MMLEAEKINQMHSIARRIVSKCKVEEPRFSEHVQDYWLGDQVVMLAEGRLRGKVFGVWMPVAGEMYRDETYRALLNERAESVWRSHAISALVPVFTLMGPKGKLPA